jgi:predicted transcriptional regulator
MKQQNILIFTDKEEEFVNLLIKIGTKKTIAEMLVYLANTPEATSRNIERGTDLRQPEVSIAIRYLTERGWIQSREIPSEKKGRPQRTYSLAVPVKEIIAAIEKEKKSEMNSKLALAVVITAGCTGVSGPAHNHADTPQGTTDTSAPDTRPEPTSTDNSTAAMACIERTGDPRTYPMNITDANKNSLNRKEFLEVNREYMAFLARELGQEKAEKMMNDEYSRLKGPRLLYPSSGNDTLISITIDPVGVHTAGESFDISGTTNLPPGRELTLIIFPGNYDRAILPCEDPWHDPVPRTAVVRTGQPSKNT